MAFLGYLLKINGTIFPNKFIAIDSYQSTPNQITDLDSYTDADGVLHRNTLPHTRTKTEFNTPYLSLADKKTVQGFFSNRVSFTAEYWNDESNSYKTGKFYVPDLTFLIYSMTENDILYKPTRIALIEY